MTPTFEETAKIVVNLFGFFTLYHVVTTPTL